MNQEENKNLINEENSSNGIDIYEIFKEDKAAAPYDEIIEEARAKLNQVYKKSKLSSNIFMVIAVAIIIPGIILFAQKDNQALETTGVVLTVLAFVILLAHFFVNKNKFPNATKVYVKELSNALNSHLFSNDNYDKLRCNPNDKIEQSDVLADGVYNAITNVGSRNVVTGSYQGHSFSVSDVAVYKAGLKKGQQDISFIGKRITYQNNLHFEGRYIINVFNPEKTPIKDPNNNDSFKEAKLDTPNNVADLEMLESLENLTVYGPKDTDYKKELSTKFLNFVKKINIDKTLLNANIVIWAGQSIAYYSYGDEVIGLPFEKPFEKGPTDRCKKDIEELFEGLQIINE